MGTSHLTSKELDRRAWVMRRALNVLLDGEPHKRSELYDDREGRRWADRFILSLDKAGVIVSNGGLGSASRRQVLDTEQLKNLMEILTGQDIMRAVARQMHEHEFARANSNGAQASPEDPPLAEVPQEAGVVQELAERLGGILTVLEAQHRRLSALEDLLGANLADGIASGLGPLLQKILDRQDEILGRLK
jgi:hypothetical protein